jgi:hypothetical protein
MDNISISNIFSGTNDFRPLDVNNLYNNAIKSNYDRNKINFNIDRLTKLREERKNKILITLANNLNKTEVMFDVPEVVYGYPDYNVTDCVIYIVKKIKDMKLDALIFNKSVYISWLDLQEKA